MKKVRTIKISVTTREILVTRSETQNSFVEMKDISVCPVCCSHLAEPLPLSVEVLNTEPSDDIYKNTEENFND